MYQRTQAQLRSLDDNKTASCKHLVSARICQSINSWYRRTQAYGRERGRVYGMIVPFTYTHLHAQRYNSVRYCSHCTLNVPGRQTTPSIAIGEDSNGTKRKVRTASGLVIEHCPLPYFVTNACIAGTRRGYMAPLPLHRHVTQVGQWVVLCNQHCMSYSVHLIDQAALISGQQKCNFSSSLNLTMLHSSPGTLPSLTTTGKSRIFEALPA